MKTHPPAPHVFGDAQVDGVEVFSRTGSRLKQKRKRGPASALDSIPTHFQLFSGPGRCKKSLRLGFDWPDMKGPLARSVKKAKNFTGAWNAWRKARSKEEKEEKRQEMEEEFGDILFALVNLSRFQGSIRALHQVTGSSTVVSGRWKRSQAGIGYRKMTLAEMDRLWEAENSRAAETTGV